MMSSEEESECVAKQQEPLLVLKKSKRMRQRVDAGEPRNSYASIPNFSSRPQVTGGYQNNGYSVPDHALTGAYSNSSSGNNNNEDIADNNNVLHSGITTSSSSSSSSSNGAGVKSGGSLNHSVADFSLQGRGEQPAFRATTAPPRMLLQPKVEKFEKMCSADDAGQQPQQQGDAGGVLAAIKQEVDDHTSNSSVASSSSSSSLMCTNNNVDENSQLLREILQGGSLGVGAAASGKAVKNALRSMQQHRGDANGLLQTAVNGGKSSGGSIISQLLRSGNGGVGKEDAAAASCRSGTLVQLLLSSDESEETDAAGATSPSGRRPSDTEPTATAMNDVGETDPAATTMDDRGRRGSSCSTAHDEDDGASAEDDDGAPEKMSVDEQQQQGVAAAALSPAAGVTPTTPSTAAAASSPSMPQASGVGSAAATDADLKRARVENIISSMRSSPFRPSTGETQQGNGGCKKRKLYMPQQHESKAASNGGAGRDFSLEYEEEEDGVEPVAVKQRRTGYQQEVLRRQLSQMQKQIAAIQMKLDSYDHQNGSDTDPMDSPRSDAGDGDVLVVGGSGGGGGGSRLIGGSVAAAAAGRSVLRGAVGASPLHHGRLSVNSPLQFHLGYVGGHHGVKPSVEHLEPAHFIDEARRLVSEQERLAKAASASMLTSAHLQAAPACGSPFHCGAEPKVAATAPSGPVSRGGSSSDWDRLADSLKMGMSSLIDDWVRRCAASKSSRHQAAAILEGSSCKELQQSSPTAVSASSAPASVSSSLIPPSSSSSALISASVASCVPTSSASASACISAFSSSAAAAAANAVALHGLADRRSPRTKVIDRGRMGGVLAASLGGAQSGGGGASPSVSAAAAAAAVHELFKYSGHLGELNHLKHSIPGLFPPPPKSHLPLYVPHPQPQPPQPLTFYGGNHSQMSGVGGGESPEQSEALPLVVTHKKKRHKVTDTRITPRTVSRLLQGSGQQDDGGSKLLSLMNGRGSPVEGGVGSYPHPQHPHHSPMVPVSLPTSVAIPNPSLHQSDVYSPYPYYHHPGAQPHHHRGSPPSDGDTQLFHPHHPLILRQQNSPEPINYGAQMKAENGDSSDCNSADMMYDGTLPTSSTLTPMHLRKAKLMFFYVRYPSSAILKTYFPDIKFNKNNTAQLVKWFSNFREFYYIQMEKYARQAISEGCKVAEDLTVTIDSELYRVLNLHYNRNNHIEVPVTFRYVVEQTLREFFKAVFAGKDTEQSWKKSIYKVIARMDDNLPEYFKSPNFLEQLE